MQIRAPLLLERIFEDFFADSPLRIQEDEQAQCQRQRQAQLLNHNTQGLNHSITGGHNGSHGGIAIPCMDNLQSHKAEERTRRQAKWDAVRMLGVLYALDKTHVGPSSSSTSALVLSGASDIIERPAAADHNPELDDSQACDSQSSMSPLSVASTSPPVSSSSIMETRNEILMLSDLQLQCRQQFTQPASLGSLFQRQWVARKAGRSLPLERRDFPRTSSLEAEPHRSLSHKKGHRSRPSPISGSRSMALQSCGGQNRDRPLGQSHEERMTAPSLPSPSTCASSWQGSSSTKIHDSVGHFNIQKAASMSDNKRCAKRRLKEEKINDKTMLEEEWKGHANGQDIETRDQLVNTNDLDYCTGPYKEAQMSNTNISHVPFKEYPLTKSENDNWAESSTTFSESVSRLGAARSFAIPSGSEASPIMESLPRPLTLPSTPTSSRMQSTASFGEGNHCQNEGQSQYHQPILNRNDKIAFLTKYTDRMHRKLQALEIKDWRNEDIQRKKTYQLMIRHNDKSGEKDLVDFYLGRYGGSLHSNQERLEQ
ncbi:hypothetical protein BGX20_000435 [Mortierella sp. AD010]|nr:hypothetical protein BGX20_000435 [Mortierella sp. AD010]